MRLASVAGRAVQIQVEPDGRVRGVDVQKASGGQFGPDLAGIYDTWEEFTVWARGHEFASFEDTVPVDVELLDSPIGTPRQVFAIGLNYESHVAEAGVETSGRGIVPPTFTKFAASLAPPHTTLVLPSDVVDWEAELVVVIGRHAEAVSVDDAWTYVAGLAVGQDYSERAVQTDGPYPQFALGKSYPGFGPVGPWLTTPDELPDPTDLEIVCEVNGEQVQKGRTSAMVWPVADLITSISAVCALLPGDVIFTGTPAGVGFAMTPKRFLSAGDVVVTRIEGLGEIRQVCQGEVGQK